MALRLYNTLTRVKEGFVPLDAANVRMYVCGPTVYDFAHIGNARPVIVFDVLFRLLRQIYGAGHVTYVRNVTDVDDKINARALQRWTRQRPLLDEMRELTEATAAQFEADVTELGCLPPTHQPRATDFVCDSAQPLDMQRIIERLVAKGHAYLAEGHVLFHVPSMPAYGRLSRRSLDDMIAGSRVEVAPYKRDPMDFVLWKPSDPETEPGWPSPWGFGRPGWHVECSAMAGALLGDIFDIHGGGIDLMFPHHENEIAQTCGALGVDKMATIWLHNGFLQVEGHKMSKSLGNFVTIREVLKDWPGEVVRLNMLKTHYRAPIDWTLRGLEEAQKSLAKWATQLEATTGSGGRDGISDGSGYGMVFSDGQGGGFGGAGSGQSSFLGALSDDLNTPLAIAIIHSMRNVFELERSLELLGIDARGYASRLSSTRASADPARVNALVKARLDARRAKDFAESDRIRGVLAAMEIQLQDSRDAETGELTTTWETRR